jgi:hypothetical protein
VAAIRSTVSMFTCDVVVVNQPVASSLNRSGGSIVGGHDEVMSEWKRHLSSRGDEGSRRAGPVVLIV